MITRTCRFELHTAIRRPGWSRCVRGRILGRRLRTPGLDEDPTVHQATITVHLARQPVVHQLQALYVLPELSCPSPVL